MIVAVDHGELGAEDLGILLLRDAFKGAPHDGDDHVEDDKHGNESAEEEDQPEDDDVLCVIHEVLSNLKVTQGKPV